MPTTPMTDGNTASPLRFAPRLDTELNDISRLFRVRGQFRSFKRGATVLLHGAPVDQVYQVVSGFVRCCTFTESGCRQIFNFSGPGDLLGFPDLDTWHFTAEAVGPVEMRCLASEVLEAALLSDPGVSQGLRRNCVREFERRERHLIWLSHLHAQERLLAFLADFAPHARMADGFTRLPMTRQDLGDHLGMTLETVSRIFGALKQQGAIRMSGANNYRIMVDNTCSATAA